jgi:hypothetical protein
MSDFLLIPIALHRFFTRIALGDADLHLSLASAVEEKTMG